MEKRYCIIKIMTIPNGNDIYVIMLDGSSEVLEYEDRAEACTMADIMETNSDSGWTYIVKDI